MINRRDFVKSAGAFLVAFSPAGLAKAVFGEKIPTLVVGPGWIGGSLHDQVLFPDVKYQSLPVRTKQFPTHVVEMAGTVNSRKVRLISRFGISEQEIICPPETLLFLGSHISYSRDRSWELRLNVALREGCTWNHIYNPRSRKFERLSRNLYDAADILWTGVGV